LTKWVSVATFLDAGKVAHDWEDIGLGGLKQGYGFGVRVHSNRQTFARIDVGAGGGEGSRLFLKLGTAF
jgi:outer membrane translocation and assembly module TamA